MNERPASVIFALLMLAAFALLYGGMRLFRVGERRKAALMFVCAAVMVANVLIWTI